MRVVVLREGNVKSAVIQALASQKELTTKALHDLTVNDFGLRVSYQAVHKVLSELARDNIVVKSGRRYYLSNAWIGNMKQLLALIELNY